MKEVSKKEIFGPVFGQVLFIEAVFGTKLLLTNQFPMKRSELNFTEEDRKVLERYPFQTTDHYLSLAENDRNDPIYRQIMPDIAELADETSSFDPLAEELHKATARLVHRYCDRVLLLTTGKCFLRCRFCLRKRFWNGTNNSLPEINETEIEEAFDYISKHREIKELLLSGGDVLTLDAEKINHILARFSAIEHLDVIRIGSRLLTVDPERINGRLLDILTSYPKVWYMSHFNHPGEITSQTADAAQKLVSKGVIILNQTVLMKGINDNAETLIELCQKLTSIKIKPHYLFHIDPVRGVRHFATGIQKGRELLKALRGRLSSISTPTFAIDLPNGGGKVSLQYDYETAPNTFPDTENSQYIYYDTK